ncbi:MAG: glycerophosphoryl diester phosphodiesterase [Salibacteraceae bacterium]|jgi:glycerophosphoryl diester phosphodiesterase
MEFDTQGHRGFTGRFPENSLPGFIGAIDTGVLTLEMDVVMSKDGNVVVSHDLVMLKSLCLAPTGKPLKDDSKKLYNLRYANILDYDCGSLGNSKFPNQKKSKTYKPLLSEVFTAADEHTAKNNLPEMRFNIEIKSSPAGDGVLHPKPSVYAEAVSDIIKLYNAEERCTIQSFDLRILQYLQRTECEVPLALLVDNELGVEKNVDLLGFDPDIYSCQYKLLSESEMQVASSLGLDVVPWTVNDKADMERLIDWGVDGLISDFPDLLMKVAKSKGVA